VADLESLGFDKTHSAAHCQFYSRHYLLEGGWHYATVDHVLWKGEWNWQVSIWGVVSEPNAPQGAVRQVRLYNPTREELETAFALMRVPSVRLSRDKRGDKVVDPATTAKTRLG
jgi:hypothetical protein